MTTKSKHTQFFALLKLMGLRNDDRRDFIYDYTNGITDSLTVLSAKYPAFYNDMIRHMSDVVNQIKASKPEGEMDKLRKRVIAAIGGYLRVTGQECNITYIKATACRATGYKTFNAIPTERLRNIYNAFSKMQKDFKAVDKINQERLKRAALMN